jgi:hypothetical protein
VRRALLVPLLLLALSACSDDETQRTAAPSSASPTPSPTATSTPTPRITASTSPTPLVTATSTGRATAPARDGDVDGDGRVDEVTATQELLSVRTASGTLTAEVVADVEPPVQGVVDVDRDGRAEVFLETTRGASTVFYTPFRYDGSTLAALRVDGEPARLGVGGSVSHGDGFACRGGRVVVSTSTSDDGASFDVVTTTYAVRGHELVQVSRSAAQGVGQSDPRVAASYQVDCGSVTQDG